MTTDYGAERTLPCSASFTLEPQFFHVCISTWLCPALGMWAMLISRMTKRAFTVARVALSEVAHSEASLGFYIAGPL